MITTKPQSLKVWQSPPGRVACHFASIGMMNLLHNVNRCLIVSLIAPTNRGSMLTAPNHWKSRKGNLPTQNQSGLVDKGVESPSGLAHRESH